MAKEVNLSFDKLTVRFGGLTAVDKFSYDVEQGMIFAIIGPNGAGKTTAFNAATGIYEPTEGRVLVQGREPSRPLTWKVIALCVVCGLLTGLLLFLLSHNLNMLWKAAIKRNMVHGADDFSYREAAQDAMACLRGELALELSRNRWRVVTADGATELERVRVPTASNEQQRELLTEQARQQAEQIRRNYEQIIALGGSQRTLAQQNGKWVIRASDGERVLAEFPDRKSAVGDLQICAGIGSARRTRGVMAAIIGMMGLVIGGAGTFALWSQSRRTPDVILRGGIARTFQNIRLFPEMTVLENVLVGMERRLSSNAFAMMLRLPGVRRAEKKARSRAMELLQWVGLKKHANVLAENLPYGAQRRLEIARALATKPRILLLDEPAAGMNPTEAVELMDLVREIKRQGITVLLIEHHMQFVMGISDRIAVMDHGVKIAEGTPEEVRDDPAVIEAYLGQEDTETDDDEPDSSPEEPQ